MQSPENSDSLEFVTEETRKSDPEGLGKKKPCCCQTCDLHGKGAGKCGSKKGMEQVGLEEETASD